MKPKIIAVKLFELAKRLIVFDKQLGVYQNGEDNNYPERIERLINGSATAKPAAKLFRKYIIGKSFDEETNNFIVNKSKSTTIRKFLTKISNSYAYQCGVFIHVNYNLNHKITSLDVLPYSHCRVGKKDDKDYSGKIIVYDNWDESNGAIDKKKFNVIDVFNKNKKVISAQIEKAGNIDLYKGQVFFYNPEDTIYPLAHIDNVMNDADSEKMSSVFKNTSLRKGFFGKKIVITPPMLGVDLRMDNSLLNDDQLIEKRYAETEIENFNTTMKTFIGADSAESLLHLQMEFEGDDIEKSIKFLDVNTNINDKLFEYTEKSTSNNIRKSFANVPSILIENNDNSVFGQSGEMLKQAKIFYQDQTEEDRDAIETEILNPLLKLFEGFKMPANGLKILPLIKNTNEAID
ncbi:hypothetical protein [Flavobacterium psychrophilum]|uniref:hypothetical protein n=1 Tax=Flavobacterium psychrophilum TaxID=96345 RepID=UPI000B7C3897|nr:hypothetical protein [Flavobacterium psychrophilum]SNA77296.1 conserved hypothetical protein [Flavobacterium psychrophilum]